MAQVKRTAQGIDWKEALESDGDVLRALVHQVIEQVLEADAWARAHTAALLDLG